MSADLDFIGGTQEERVFSPLFVYLNPLGHKNGHHIVSTDPCERPGFMELIGGCMGTFPGGSFCLFFW